MTEFFTDWPLEAEQSDARPTDTAATEQLN